MPNMGGNASKDGNRWGKIGKDWGKIQGEYYKIIGKKQTQRQWEVRMIKSFWKERNEF